MHGESPPNGRLPESVRPFVTDPLSVAELSSFVAMYNRLDHGDERKVTASMLLRAWEMHCRVGRRDLDINAAWYAIRDVRSRIVEWKRCGRCQTCFIYEVNETHARTCPYCALSRAGDRL